LTFVQYFEIILSMKGEAMETQTIQISPAGNPFPVAPPSDECSMCFRGYLTLCYEEDGEEVYISIPCRRCNRE
jgi:hypothetical protein